MHRQNEHTIARGWNGVVSGWMIYERLRKFKVGQFAYRTRELFTLTMRPEDADESGGVGRNEFITRPTNWVRLRNTGS